MKVTLNKVEQRLAAFLADLRYQNAREKGVENKRKGLQSDKSTDLEGVAAELAFCKLFNLYPDTEVGHFADEDAITRKGRKVDIKSTTYETGHLIVARWKSGNVDFFALMVGRFPNYRYAGRMTADEIMQDKRLKDFGHGQVFAASQKELCR